MAQIVDGANVYLRIVTGVSSTQLNAYGSIADAQADTNPKLAPQLFSAPLTLVGNIMPLLVPVGSQPVVAPSNPHQAVSMVLRVGLPIDK